MYTSITKLGVQASQLALFQEFNLIFSILLQPFVLLSGAPCLCVSEDAAQDQLKKDLNQSQQGVKKKESDQEDLNPFPADIKKKVVMENVFKIDNVSLVLLFFFSFFIFQLTQLTMWVFWQSRLYLEEVEETRGEIQFWNGHESKTKEMTWCNDSDDERALQIISSTPKETSVLDPKPDELRTITCPSCGHNIEFQDQVDILQVNYICFSSANLFFLSLDVSN